MQHSPYEIKEKLLQALDDEYNVVDMVAVLEVITALEKAIITKEALEKTRIGKYINELRKRTNNENLARRAKDLVKSWRKLLPQTTQRINGEDSHNSIGTPPGSITVLGPGPGPGYGPGPGPGNRTFKTSISVPATQRCKTCPSVMIERSSSPYFSSASNSPLLNSLFQGSNLANVSCSYAPVKFMCHVTPQTDSPNKLNSNQSKNTSNQMFKPISPTAKQGGNLSSEANVLSHRISSPTLKNSSNSSSPSNLSVNVCSPSQPANATITVTHSILDINKANVANKRLRKEVDCNNTPSEDMDINGSKARIGNGISNTSDVDSNEITVIETINICSSDKTGGGNVVPNSKTPKRRRKNDTHERKESRLENLLVSITSSSKLPKVKTTRQLIADLHEKGNKNLSNSLPSIDALHSSDAEVSRTKSELLQKFLITSQSVKNEISQEDLNEDPNLSDSSHTVPDGSAVISTNSYFSSSMLNPVDDEIKRILSTLPPINPELDSEEEESMTEHLEFSISNDLNRVRERWEHVNGVYDCNGDWKTWQECTEQKSYQEESLQILPYVNID